MLRERLPGLVVQRFEFGLHGRLLGMHARLVRCRPIRPSKRRSWCQRWCPSTRKVTCTEYKTEQRTRTYTYYRNVPETVNVPYQYTVMVPETRTETVPVTAYRPNNIRTTIR